MRRWAPLGVAAAVAASIAAPAASAHANLVRSVPEAGEVLLRAPASVRLTFDDTVQVVGGSTVVRNGGRSVLRGVPSVVGGRQLVMLLRRGLAEGDYTVRWRIVSDDGHLISGVFAFAVGGGRASPSPSLSAGGGPPATDLVRRWFFFAGLLVSAGLLAARGAVWGAALRFPDAKTAWKDALRVESILTSSTVAAALLAVTLTTAHGGGIGTTRFERVNTLAAVAAGIGAAAAAMGIAYPPLIAVAGGGALVALVTPTLRGHALDPGHSRLLAVGADLAHVATAALWLGGLLYLAVVLPAAARRLPPALRRPLQVGGARRVSALAGAALVGLVVSGLLRAVGELSSVSQLWSTGYGRVVLVKSGLLGALVTIGWQNRRRLGVSLAFERLRRRVLLEVIVLAGVIVAVSVLTDLRPAWQVARAGGRAGSIRGEEATLPASAPGTVVLARETREFAVALAARPVGEGLSLTATVLGPDRLGVDGLSVAFDVIGSTRAHAAGSPCGGGCYQAVIRLAGRPRVVSIVLIEPRRPALTARFPLSRSWPAPAAAALVRRAERAFGRVRTLVLHERLASGPGRRARISTVFEYVAPDRMRYRIAGGGPQGIVIGRLRWDRVSSTARWQISGQEPAVVPRPFWLSATDASLLGTSRVRGRPVYVVSFLDRRIPAWFTAWIDRRNYRTLELRMTAAAHFMRHVYGPFDAPLAIQPPTVR